jgi:hypothetical protein
MGRVGRDGDAALTARELARRAPHGARAGRAREAGRALRPAAAAVPGVCTGVRAAAGAWGHPDRTAAMTAQASSSSRACCATGAAIVRVREEVHTGARACGQAGTTRRGARPGIANRRRARADVTASPAVVGVGPQIDARSAADRATGSARRERTVRDRRRFAPGWSHGVAARFIAVDAAALRGVRGARPIVLSGVRIESECPIACRGSAAKEAKHDAPESTSLGQRLPAPPPRIVLASSRANPAGYLTR